MARISRIVLFFIITAAVTAFGLGAALAAAVSDSTFVRKATDSNTLEISLGEMAQNQAASPQVRQLGQRMAKDYIVASNQLLDIAKNDNIQVSADLDKADYPILRDLQGMKGPDFDRKYIKHIVEERKDDISMFEQMANEGTNPDLRNYARQNLPILREHLRTAEDIYNRIEQG